MACAPNSDLAPATPLVLYTGHVRGVPGAATCCSTPRWTVRPRPAGRAVPAGRRAPRSARARRRRELAAARPGASRHPRRASGPPTRFPHFLDAADVLVSPRSRGTNTPLKIYQYLRSGRPIVATRLLTHTQVLSDEIAILTAPTPVRIRGRHSRGDCAIPSAPARIGARAAELAATKYSYDAYLAPDARGGWAPRAGRRARPVQRRRGVSAEPLTRRQIRPLQLHRLRRPGDGRGVRPCAIRRADRRAAGRVAGRGAARLRRSTARRAVGARRRHRHGAGRAGAGGGWRLGDRARCIVRDAARGRGARRGARRRDRVRGRRCASPGASPTGRSTWR